MTPEPTPQAGGEEPADVPVPVIISLVVVGLVWVAGAIWSFEHQTKFAESLGFDFPQLLPSVADGLPIALAATAFAAALDGRGALAARLGTALAVAGSAASNGIYAWRRSDHDLTTVLVAVAVPVLAAVAFEVALGEIRRQVQLRRGEIRRKPKAQERAPMPPLRPIRVLLDPFHELSTWRRTVLTMTDPAVDPAAREAMARLVASVRAERAATALTDTHPLPGSTPLPEAVGSGERFEAPHPDQAPATAPAARRQPAARPARRAPGKPAGRKAVESPAERAALVERAKAADAAARERTGRPLPYREGPAVLGVRYATAREALDAARAQPAPAPVIPAPASGEHVPAASGNAPVGADELVGAPA